MPKVERRAIRIPLEETCVFTRRLIALSDVASLPQPEPDFAALTDSILYREIARKAGVEGDIFVHFTVDSLGVVHDVDLLRGLGAGLEDEVMRTIQAVTFEPARLRGRPVAAKMEIVVAFQLEPCKSYSSP